MSIFVAIPLLLEPEGAIPAAALIAGNREINKN